MTIGVSTLAFSGMSREDIVRLAKENGWLIEFSSSFPYQEDMAAFFCDTDIRRLAHNYFPAPRDPFVLNLASGDPEIRERSIGHCLQGLRLTRECGMKYFSAHAGFCIDPDPAQLGRQLLVEGPLDREKHWSLFIESIRRILAESREWDVSFLIENNVTARKNLRKDGQQVLFCATPEEMLDLVREIDDPGIGILLDTAHLKVSAASLHFDLDEAVSLIKNDVRYIHHSDNDGEEDTNGPIDGSYWFLPRMGEFADCIHILEVKKMSAGRVKEQLRLLQDHGKI